MDDEIINDDLNFGSEEIIKFFFEMASNSISDATAISLFHNLCKSLLYAFTQFIKLQNSINISLLNQSILKAFEFLKRGLAIQLFTQNKGDFNCFIYIQIVVDLEIIFSFIQKLKIQEIQKLNIIEEKNT